MKGLRKFEGKKFNRFFSLIQAEAERQGKIFFADAGDGNDFKLPDMVGENMMGWLIPKEMEVEFKPLWKASKVDDSWTDFYKWAIWTQSGDSIAIHFED